MTLKSWREIPIGGVVPKGGTSEEYNTGSWRAHRPDLDRDKCNDCLLCWIYCPDSSVQVQDAKLVDFDWDHCKGCGICAEVCPVSAITMIEEAAAEKV